jgi:hypothetical protein
MPKEQQPVAVTKQYAIYIGLSDPLIANAREQLAKSDCMETYEVCIQYNQQVKVFTFEEFIGKLFHEEVKHEKAKEIIPRPEQEAQARA